MNRGYTILKRRKPTLSRVLLSWYQHYRDLGYTGIRALRNARIRIRFDALESEDRVRLHTEPEIDYYDDSYIDTWAHLSERSKARLKEEIAERIDREGHWILIGQWRKSPDDAWESADNCGGFIGDDYIDSGYDSDIMRATIEAFDDANQREADSLDSRATYAAGDLRA